MIDDNINFVFFLNAGSGAGWAVTPRMPRNLWTKLARMAALCQMLQLSITLTSFGMLMSNCMVSQWSAADMREYLGQNAIHLFYDFMHLDFVAFLPASNHDILHLQ